MKNHKGKITKKNVDIGEEVFIIDYTKPNQRGWDVCSIVESRCGLSGMLSKHCRLALKIYFPLYRYKCVLITLYLK